MKDKKVNILGTEYTITVRKIEDDEEMTKRRLVGMCGELTKVIIVADADDQEHFPYMSEPEQAIYMKETLRHEIIHAFFNESGLKESSSDFDGPWCKNEEMIDWIALQGPKLIKAWKEAGAI